MANELLQGLLSNLLTPVDPRAAQRAEGARLVSMMGTPGAAATYYAPQRAADFTKGLGQLFGMDQRTSADKIREQLSKNAPDLSTSTGLAQMAQLAQQSGDANTAAQFAMQAKMVATQEAQAAEKIKQEGAAREALANQAQAMGLETVATSLLSGGDIKEATAAITSLEKENLLATGGRPAKLAIARATGSGAAMLRDIAAGAYDTLSPVDFQGMLEGTEAELKPFLDSSGTARILRVSTYGRVLNEDTQQWVNPGELNLRPAPTKTETLTAVDAFGTKLWDGEATRFVERSKTADDAVISLTRNQQATDLLDKGIKSGAYANFRLGLAKALKQLGVVTGESDNEQIANTETYMISRASEVANIIKAFGAGTGLSDADRAYAEKIAAGDIGLDEQSMRNILAMERTANTSVVTLFNKDLDTFIEKGIGGGNLDIYRKNIPTPPLSASQIAEITSKNTANNITVVEVGGKRAYLRNDKWYYEDGSEAK